MKHNHTIFLHGIEKLKIKRTIQSDGKTYVTTITAINDCDDFDIVFFSNKRLKLTLAK